MSADSSKEAPTGTQSTPKKRGRPTKYSEKLTAKICSELAKGKSLRTIREQNDWCPNLDTIFQWLHRYQTFAEQYARAKEESADALVDEMLDIVDDGSNDWMTQYNRRTGRDERVFDREHYERSKLRFQARQWMASKLKPKRYGDKLDLSTNGKDLPTPIFAGLSQQANTPEQTPPQTN